MIMPGKKDRVADPDEIRVEEGGHESHAPDQQLRRRARVFDAKIGDFVSSEAIKWGPEAKDSHSRRAADYRIESLGVIGSVRYGAGWIAELLSSGYKLVTDLASVGTKKLEQVSPMIRFPLAGLTFFLGWDALKQGFVIQQDPTGSDALSKEEAETGIASMQRDVRYTEDPLVPEFFDGKQYQNPPAGSKAYDLLAKKGKLLGPGDMSRVCLEGEGQTIVCQDYFSIVGKSFSFYGGQTKVSQDAAVYEDKVAILNAAAATIATMNGGAILTVLGVSYLACPRLYRALIDTLNEGISTVFGEVGDWLFSSAFREEEYVTIDKETRTAKRVDPHAYTRKSNKDYRWLLEKFKNYLSIHFFARVAWRINTGLHDRIMTALNTHDAIFEAKSSSFLSGLSKLFFSTSVKKMPTAEVLDELLISLQHQIETDSGLDEEDQDFFFHWVQMEVHRRRFDAMQCFYPRDEKFPFPQLLQLILALQHERNLKAYEKKGYTSISDGSGSEKSDFDKLLKAVFRADRICSNDEECELFKKQFFEQVSVSEKGGKPQDKDEKKEATEEDKEEDIEAVPDEKAQAEIQWSKSLFDLVLIYLQGGIPSWGCDAFNLRNLSELRRLCESIERKKSVEFQDGKFILPDDSALKPNAEEDEGAAKKPEHPLGMLAGGVAALGLAVSQQSERDEKSAAHGWGWFLFASCFCCGDDEDDENRADQYEVSGERSLHPVENLGVHKPDEGTPLKRSRTLVPTKPLTKTEEKKSRWWCCSGGQDDDVSDGETSELPGPEFTSVFGKEVDSKEDLSSIDDDFDSEDSRAGTPASDMG